MSLCCTICVKSFMPSDDVRATICGHMFHNQCINQWLQNGSTCPTCHAPCTGTKLTRLYLDMNETVKQTPECRNKCKELERCMQDLENSRKKLNEVNEIVVNIRNSNIKQSEILVQLYKNIGNANVALHERRKRIERYQNYMDNLKGIQEYAKIRGEKVHQAKTLRKLMEAPNTEVKDILASENDPAILMACIKGLKSELKICQDKLIDLENERKPSQE